MKRLPLSTRSIAMAMVLLPLLLAFGYVVARSGPLAPVRVTIAEVEQRPLAPALYGIGTVEARYRYQVGPVMTGRLLRLEVDVGDRVTAGQLLGEMDPVDMDERIAAREAAIKRAEASVAAAEARLRDSMARASFAKAQTERYRRLAAERNVSREAADGKQQAYRVAQAGLAAAQATLRAAREELVMLQADHQGLLQQRANLRLYAPADGLVVGRHIEPGSTVVAGQAVLELIDPQNLWLNVRFNQLQSGSLATGLAATILLRSRATEPFTGRVMRIEPLADPVTEELLAKVVFEYPPEPLPPLGELAEVTVTLPRTEAAPVVSNASIKRRNGQTGVWRVEANELRFARVEVGESDLEGRVQILQGISVGDEVVLYSEKELNEQSRIRVVERLVSGSS